MSLLTPNLAPLVQELLHNWCHRTGERYRQSAIPLSRSRTALSALWLTDPPSPQHPNKIRDGSCLFLLGRRRVSLLVGVRSVRRVGSARVLRLGGDHLPPVAAAFAGGVHGADGVFVRDLGVHGAVRIAGGVTGGRADVYVALALVAACCAPHPVNPVSGGFGAAALHSPGEHYLASGVLGGVEACDLVRHAGGLDLALDGVGSLGWALVLQSRL